MTKFCDISEEMKLEILTRLPPKALMRFKSVCKSLFHLINNPRFVAKNLSNSLNNIFASTATILFRRTVLKDNTITDKSEIFHIMRDGNNEKKETFISLLNLCIHNFGEGQNYLNSVVEDLTVPSPLGICPFNLKIVGHCDGIICLTSNEHVVLCNPAIKEFKYLPPSCLILPPKQPEDYDNLEDYYDAIESGPTAVGFGYDSEAQMYKAVRIVEFSSGYTFTSHPTRTEVYTVRAHSWREINFCGDNTSVFWAPSFEIYFKGFFYWNATTSPTPGQHLRIILSFDMNSDRFHEILFPEKITEGGFLVSLAVWKESIVLIAYGNEKSKTMDLWAMDDFDGSNNLWTKQLSINVVEGEIPLIFWQCDEILMVTDNGRVISYNYGTQVLKNLPIFGVNEDHIYMQAVAYVNSITSVKGESMPSKLNTCHPAY